MCNSDLREAYNNIQPTWIPFVSHRRLSVGAGTLVARVELLLAGMVHMLTQAIIAGVVVQWPILKVKMDLFPLF